MEVGSCNHLYEQLLCICHYAGDPHIPCLKSLCYFCMFFPSIDNQVSSIHILGNVMDWPTPESLLFCWWHSLGILWGRHPLFTQKHECFHVRHISTYWDSKCSNDGMIYDFALQTILHVMELCGLVSNLSYSLVSQVLVDFCFPMSVNVFLVFKRK